MRSKATELSSIIVNDAQVSCALNGDTVRHRGLRRLLEGDSPQFLSQDLVGRVRNILTSSGPGRGHGGVRCRSGDRDGAFIGFPANRQNEWSIAVSGNWRITFEETDGTIERLNLEDYH